MSPAYYPNTQQIDQREINCIWKVEIVFMERFFSLGAIKHDILNAEEKYTI